MQPIDMRVHDVEIFDPLRDRLEQSGACGRGIGGRPAEAERAGPDRMQFPARAGISAGELVTSPRLTSSSTSHATTLSVPP